MFIKIFPHSFNFDYSRNGLRRVQNILTNSFTTPSLVLFRCLHLLNTRPQTPEEKKKRRVKRRQKRLKKEAQKQQENSTPSQTTPNPITNTTSIAKKTRTKKTTKQQSTTPSQSTRQPKTNPNIATDLYSFPHPLPEPSRKQKQNTIKTFTDAPTFPDQIKLVANDNNNNSNHSNNNNNNYDNKIAWTRPTIVLTSQKDHFTPTSQFTQTDQSGQPLTKEEQIEKLIRERSYYVGQIAFLEQQRDLQGLRSLVASIETSQISHTQALIGKLVASLHRLKLHDDVNKLFTYLIRVGTHMTTALCNSFLAHYASTGDVSKVKKVQEIMKYSLIPRDSYTFNSLLKLAILRGDSESIQRILDDMGRENISPGTVTYNQILTPLAKSGKFGEVQKVLDQMKLQSVDRDQATYGILIEAHARAGNWTTINSLIREMNENEVTVGVRIYNTIMTQASKRQKWAKCDQIWDLIKKEQFPSKASYNIRMRVLLMMGRDRELEELFKEMEENDIPLDDEGYVSLIAGANWKRDPELCQKYFEEMKEKKLRIETPAYYFVLHAWVKKGDFPKVVELFSEMRATHPSLVDSTIYELVLTNILNESSYSFTNLFGSTSLKELNLSATSGAAVLSHLAKMQDKLRWHDVFMHLDQRGLISQNMFDSVLPYLSADQIKTFASAIPLQVFETNAKVEVEVEASDSYETAIHDKVDARVEKAEIVHATPNVEPEQDELNLYPQQMVETETESADTPTLQVPSERFEPFTTKINLQLEPQTTPTPTRDYPLPDPTDLSKENLLCSEQIDQFTQDRDVEGLRSFITLLETRQIPHDSTVLQKLVVSLLKVRLRDDSTRLFTHLCQMGTRVMSVSLCNTFLTLFIAQNDIANAKRVQKIIKLANLRPNAYTFKLLLYLEIKNGDIEAVQKIFNEMTNYKTPKVATYNLFFTTLIKANKLEECQKIFRKMQQQGVACNSETYGILIQAHTRARNWTTIDSLIREMNEKGVKPDTLIYKWMLRQAMMKRNWPECDEIWRLIRQHKFVDKESYEIRFSLCVVRGNEKEMKQILKEMADKGMPTDGLALPYHFKNIIHNDKLSQFTDNPEPIKISYSKQPPKEETEKHLGHKSGKINLELPLLRDAQQLLKMASKTNNIEVIKEAANYLILANQEYTPDYSHFSDINFLLSRSSSLSLSSPSTSPSHSLNPLPIPEVPSLITNTTPRSSSTLFL